MMCPSRVCLAFAIAVAVPSSFAQKAPALQWIKQLGGSGQVSAVAGATDAHGDLYLVGNTSSLTFPVVNAAQPQPGGSPLVRIDSGGPQSLIDPLLTNATKFAADPENASTLYAGAAGALIRSNHSGASWSVVDTFKPVSLISSITIDPSNSNLLYVSANSDGLFRSADGGATWAALNQAIPPAVNSTNFYVNQVWVDPAQSSTLFATTSSGLIRSADSGASWSVVLVNDITASLVFDPFTPGTIYESGAGRTGYAFKSTDDGLTWTPLPSAPQWYPGQLIADPFHAGVLYFSANPGIFQSVDGGATWTLKIGKPSGTITADPGQPVLYATLGAEGVVVRSTDGFGTYQTLIGIPATQIVPSGAQLFIAAAPSTDVFLVKLDPQGGIVYSTYWGGSASDSATGLALGADGSVYVTGSTTSLDFPVTNGAYLTTPPPGSGRAFVFKLNSDGSLAWSTYFADSRTTPLGIAVDPAGGVYITGATYGNLPVTDGAYETTYQPVGCGGPGGIFCPLPQTAAFLTKFAPDGSALVFSTYVFKYKGNPAFSKGASIALDPAGNAYVGGNGAVFLMSSDGSSLVGANAQNGAQINALVLDAQNNVFATGQTTGAFTATPGAFQTAPQPPAPALPGQGIARDAFIVKFDSTLSRIAAGTLLGGEGTDAGQSIAIDVAGNVVLGGTTTSKAFPTRAPLQAAFSDYSGFVATLDPSLATLLFSSYIGDNRFFGVRGVASDASSDVLLFGSTLVTGSSFCLPTPCDLSAGPAAFVNKIALPAAPRIRLDAVLNTASQYAVPLSPGESIDAVGSGFDSDTQLLLNGTPLVILARAAGRLTARVPADMATTAPARITAISSGSSSTAILLPTAQVSPGIYSVDGSGVGQGYILNSDGSVNSPDNPATVGSAITIFATGVGAYTLDGPYAVTAQPVSVFVDGFYADGISADIRDGKYAISVYIPDPSKLADQNPNLLNFKMPPQVSVLMVMGPILKQNPAYSVSHSQLGLALSVKSL